MSLRLRVLIVGDHSTDSAGLIDALRVAGYEAQWELVNTPAALKAALPHAWDLVMVDDALPGMSVSSLVTAVRSLDAYVACLVVTREATDDVVLAALHAGADDVVGRSGPTGLALVVARVLRDAAVRREHMDTEVTLRGRVQMNAVVAELATHFISSAPGEIHAGIDRALQTIGECAGVDRSCIFQLSADGGAMNMTHEWCAPDVAPARQWSQGLGMKPFPWWREKVMRREALQFRRLSDLPPEAGPERALFAARGIRSIVATPMIGRDGLVGMLSFVMLRGERDWSTADLNLLDIVAALLVSALERQRDDETRRRLQAERASALEGLQMTLQHMPVGCMILDTAARYTYWNPAAERIFGYSFDEVRGKHPFETIVPHQEQARSLAALQRVAEGEAIGPGIAENYTKDGRKILCEWRSVPLRTPDGAVAGMVSMCEDITDRMHTERALRDSERRYRAVSELTSDYAYAFRIEPNGETVGEWIAGAFERITGFSPDELVARGGGIGVIHPDDLPIALQRIQRLIGGDNDITDYRIITRSGSVRWVRDHGRAEWDDERRRVVRIYGAAQDITESRRAGEEKATLLEVARDIAGTFDLESLLAQVQRRTVAALPCDAILTFYRGSSSVLRLRSHYGVPTELVTELSEIEFARDGSFSEELRGGRSIVGTEATVVPEVDSSLAQRFGLAKFAIAPLMVRGRWLGLLVALRRTDGPPFEPDQVQLFERIAGQLAVAVEAADLYRAQQDEAHAAGALARVAREMMSSVSTPAVLERLCRLTSELLECDFSHTFLRDAADGALVAASGHGDAVEQWEALRVLRIPEAVVSQLIERFGQDDIVQVVMSQPQDMVPATLPSQFGITVAMYMALRQGGELIGVLTAGYRGREAPFTPHQERVARGVVHVASLALENARLFEALERANRLKSDFVATMSHELRTPLNVIVGYAELLSESLGHPAPEHREWLHRILSNARELNQLIEATLDLSRLETGQIPIELDEVHAHALLEEVRRETRDLQEKPGVRFTWNASSTLPVLWTDSAKLKVVLKNLFGNAVKFTRHGEVSIAAVVRGGGVEFAVCDTGIGIAADALPIIFEPFRQADSSMTREYGGVGLGLYIVRRLLELLGGTINVESRLGDGTTFRVWLPAQRRDGAERGNRRDELTALPLGGE